MAPSTFALDDLPAAGGVLAEPVRDANGQLLVPAGTALNPDLVAALRRRGIAAVVVFPPSTAANEEGAKAQAQASNAQAEARVQRLFRYSVKAGQLNPLLHIVRRFRLGESP
ncbi:MAG TPA: hypothetical protein VLJ57_16120 [Burkholderiaceae bacterium]|nr:hypothetical protein [Burkholderiaceae bacterium]